MHSVMISQFMSHSSQVFDDIGCQITRSGSVDVSVGIEADGFILMSAGLTWDSTRLNDFITV